MLTNLSKLCLGTSMLFNGKLVDNLSDEYQANLLQKMLNYGIKYIHTNANLNTQKKVCEVSKNYPNLQHIVKIEASIDSILKDDYSQILRRLIPSVENCNYINFISLEIDHSNIKNLDNQELINQWVYKSKDFIVTYLGYLPKCIFMVKSFVEFEVAKHSPYVDNVGGYTNLLQNALLIEAYESKFNKNIVGFSPFSRGRIFSEELNQSLQFFLIQKKIFLKGCNFIDLVRTLSFHIALNCPNVSILTIGIYNESNLNWVMQNLNSDSKKNLPIDETLEFMKTNKNWK